MYSPIDLSLNNKVNLLQYVINQSILLIEIIFCSSNISTVTSFLTCIQGHQILMYALFILVILALLLEACIYTNSQHKFVKIFYQQNIK